MLKEEAAVMGRSFRVIAPGLNLRTVPHSDADVIAVLPRNHIVDLLAAPQADGWGRVKTLVFLYEVEGFVATRFLAPLREPAAVRGNLAVTAEKLRRLAPNARAAVIEPLDGHADAVLAEHGINANARRLTHFLAQVAHESGGFRLMEENLDYTADRLMSVFPSRFPTAEIASVYAGNPERLANRLYGGRLGNGPESSGDGWRYRGRGLLQLTGRANHRHFGRRIGIDLENEPERAAEPLTALKVAGAYWDERGLNGPADQNELQTITRRINGGLNGLEDRRAYLQRARAIWG